MTNPNDEALARRAQQVEAEGLAYSGSKENWDAAMKALARKMESGELSQAELLHKMNKQSAGGDIFNMAAGEMSEQDWRRWRDAQPNRARRIEKANRRRVLRQ